MFDYNALGGYLFTAFLSILFPIVPIFLLVNWIADLF